MTKYTHAVVNPVLIEENGESKQSEELTYAINMEHAFAIAHQLMAAGKMGVSIVQLKEPKTISDSE